MGMRTHSPFLIFAAALASVPAARADDLTLTDQPGPRQLISLGGNRILEWNPTTAGYRVWDYDAAATSGNPLILPAVASGTWNTIVSGHELLYVGDDVVLDWVPLTGGYRFWHYDRSATGSQNPFPGSPIASGTFNTIRAGHQLVYLGDVGSDATPARILDWELDSGHYRVWRYDRTATGSTNPFLTQSPSPVATDTFATIHAGHELTAVNFEHSPHQVLDFEPATGNFRLFDVNGDATGGTNPLVIPARTSGTFNTVGLGHRLIYLRGNQRVLDWEPVTGHNRVWSFNPNVSSGSNPLSGPVTNFTWSTVVSSTPKITTQSDIKHIVIIEMENKSFDSYFGTWCTGGHNPTCNTAGWPGFSANACCERAPSSYTSEGGTVFTPYPLTNCENQLADRDHSYACEVKEMNGGAMNRFFEPGPDFGVCTTDPDNDVPRTFACQSDRSFEYSHGEDDIIEYYELADAFALADHYFQPTAGASASNDVFLAGAHFYFRDNACSTDGDVKPLCIFDQTTSAPMDVGALLWTAGVPYTVYAGRLHETTHPFEKKDNGFAYFRDPHTRDPRLPDHSFLRDVDELQWDLDAGTLPPVSLVKPDNHDSEHPGGTLTDGVNFSTEVLNRILGSQFASRTLIILTYDESGGFYDHMTPPPAWPTTVDSQPNPDHLGAVLPVPYGPRVPMMAIGHFARQAYISHRVMEHSSIVKFIEWNWLGGHSGQLGARDRVVNNIGDLLDPAATGVTVPAGTTD